MCVYRPNECQTTFDQGAWFCKGRIQFNCKHRSQLVGQKRLLAAVRKSIYGWLDKYGPKLFADVTGKTLTATEVKSFQLSLKAQLMALRERKPGTVFASMEHATSNDVFLLAAKEDAAELSIIISTLRDLIGDESVVERGFKGIKRLLTKERNRVYTESLTKDLYILWNYDLLGPEDLKSMIEQGGQRLKTGLSEPKLKQLKLECPTVPSSSSSPAASSSPPPSSSSSPASSSSPPAPPGPREPSDSSDIEAGDSDTD